MNGSAADWVMYKVAVIEARKRTRRGDTLLLRDWKAGGGEGTVRLRITKVFESFVVAETDGGIRTCLLWDDVVRAVKETGRDGRRIG